ncbi:hypothetical protein RF11_01761 [Thelohanellus kitauei]|uniref:PiggyBac transposable element-derived protein domain-containing protein n=1 Tax=Thelohanellus kitauei TaxID=669202 RepID=A0A0C2MU78_THEKT|nr:hypothetical protein RF11_01761 [Thelohanellus kitauei]
MSRKNFEDLGCFVHFNDHAKIMDNGNDNSYDPLSKTRPLLNILRTQCLLGTHNQHQSIDNQIIQFKGKPVYAITCQNTKTCCSRTTFTRDFTIFCGADIFETESVGYQPGHFVIQLCKTLPHHKTILLPSIIGSISQICNHDL